ncbi:integrase [Haloferax sp. Atlit-10N]|uniref:tyrosine-type recombinase/integrase n=1 Tax=unclassified Haloferax TaxID=2625095 RepID=UPI000E284801|nr:MULTISPECIES: site-specific integrase [unclassified Haloferax]RDZ44687.1 integrase [Haloferax sp. Atlit-16N]RDZ59533.1 integrase [Haloferax sp. Atlit-10N]
MSELEPLSPNEGVQLYLTDRQAELAEQTLDSYRYKLTRFANWCASEGIENLNELSGRNLLQFKQYRAEDLNPVSLKAQLDTLRTFIRFCESIDAVSPDLHNKILSPSLGQGDRERDVLVDPEQSQAVLDHVSRFQYASLHHTILTLLWRTGARSGTIRALDVDDYDRGNQRIRAKHRDGTPLKNQEKGERLIALSPDTCQVLNDYIDFNREKETEEAGRRPLLTTKFGRVSKSTIRETCYRWTHPCQYNGGHCPHGRSTDSCKALCGPEKAPSVCPSSRSPHAWRRGAITHHLTNDVPVEVVSDRMNVSPDVLEAHYDRRSEEVKVEQRRAYLEGL